MSRFEKRHVMHNHFCLDVSGLLVYHWSLSPLVWRTLMPEIGVGAARVTILTARYKVARDLLVLEPKVWYSPVFSPVFSCPVGILLRDQWRNVQPRIAGGLGF
ncbi:hypothetical protein TNCV_955071 [Trichonephila clavipes]|nr:hypothetical protein TNCV_955071 [Trichonephila clavipes]